MKRAIIFITLCLGFAITKAQDENPYLVFGYQGKVLKTEEEISGKQFLFLNTNDTTQQLKAIVFNTEACLIEYIDHNNDVYKTDTLLPTFVLRFLGTDPHSKDYPGISPYNFVGNMPIRAVDPDGRDIYILFATTGNKEYGADYMFSASALTRQKNIESSKFFDPAKDKVVVLHVSDVSQIKSMVEQTVKDLSAQYGQTKEIGVWSHAGRQGPIGTEQASIAPLGSNQMNTSGGWDNINFNWTDQNASMSFYGCNTGNELSMEGEWVGSFARRASALPNFRNVQVAGQSTSSYPSFYTDVRETSFARSAYPIAGYLLGDTYMVGGNQGQGADAMWFTPLMSVPPANPMNVYQNGQKTGSGFQSVSPSNPIEY